jgi:hypothetical protein
MQQAWWYQQGCYKLLTACFKLVDNLEQAERTQLVDDLLADLLFLYKMWDFCVGVQGIAGYCIIFT